MISDSTCLCSLGISPKVDIYLVAHMAVSLMPCWVKFIQFLFFSVCKSDSSFIKSQIGLNGCSNKMR